MALTITITLTTVIGLCTSSLLTSNIILRAVHKLWNTFFHCTDHKARGFDWRGGWCNKSLKCYYIIYEQSLNKGKGLIKYDTVVCFIILSNQLRQQWTLKAS